MSHSQPPSKSITVLATLFALSAFAGNSVLCRLALLPNSSLTNESLPSDALGYAASISGPVQAIDATSFTVLRLLSGSIALLVFMMFHSTSSKASKNLGSLKAWLAPFCLFIYAACFSFAYITLPTGAGALILFGCVQLTMIISSIMAKEVLSLQKYFGVMLAFLGLCLLMYFQSAPSAVGTHVTASDSLITAAQSQQSQQTPSILIGFILMTISGVAWAVYTLLGRSSTDPITDTCWNFVKSLPFCAALCLLYLVSSASISAYGVSLALLSGIVTSAMGYAVWYYVLPQLSRIQAGVIQLLVPVIAAIGGFIWAQEAITLSLAVSQIMVLGGIALVIFNVNRRASSRHSK